MDEKAIPMIAGNGFAELLPGPTSSRMSRDLAVQNATAPHLHDHEHVQHSEPGGDRDQNISGHDGLGVIADKRLPVLRGSSPPRSWITFLAANRLATVVGRPTFTDSPPALSP